MKEILTSIIIILICYYFVFNVFGVSTTIVTLVVLGVLYVLGMDSNQNKPTQNETISNLTLAQKDHENEMLNIQLDNQEIEHQKQILALNEQYEILQKRKELLEQELTRQKTHNSSIHHNTHSSEVSDLFNEDDFF